MGCFVHGYIGPGVSIRNLLRTAERLVPRTREGYGIVIWQEIGETPVRIRKTKPWPLFFDEGPGGTATGYVVEQLEEEGVSMRDQIRMGMVHGRWPTSGEFHGFPDNDCHPYRAEFERSSMYYVHNGHLETHRMDYNRLTNLNFRPEADTDSATCGSLLAYDILVQKKDCIEASSELVRTLESTDSTGALLFTHDMEPERMYAIRVEMPLVVVKSKWGCFLSSDVNVLRAMNDQRVEVYCLRNGAVGWVDLDQTIHTIDSGGLHSSGNYGRMFLTKTRIKRTEGMNSCLESIGGNHQIEMWDKRTLKKWSVWENETKCLPCACQARENIERISNPHFELNNLEPVNL